MASDTALLRLYAAAGFLLAPLAWSRIRRRLLAEGVAPARARERLGHATLPRPTGPLIWFHAASVGESLSILPLIDALKGRAEVLVTTVTVTAATVLAQRLPEGALHQFAPLDVTRPLTRFLDHWRPDLCVLVESEIWPQTIRLCDARAIPVALVNARLSARSLARWARAPRTARVLLGRLATVVAQTPAVRDRLVALGADAGRASVGGNMKAAAALPPDDEAERGRLVAAMGGAPVWAAISTHRGEEEIVLAAHALVRETIPDARLILVPRHPDRADAIEALARAAGLHVARRGRSEAPIAPVYLADTLGETGLWLRMAPVILLGGSLLPLGGHNPWEPARAGAAILTGPHVESVVGDMADLKAAGALAVVTDADALAAAVQGLLSDSARLDAARAASRSLAASRTNSVATISGDLIALIHA